VTREMYSMYRILAVSRAQWINRALEHIPEHQCLEAQEYTPEQWMFKEEHVGKALKITKNGLVMGLDGCPYELSGICMGLPAETRHVSNKPKIIQIGPEMKEI